MFTHSANEHRIHNPYTSENMPLLAREYGITGVGIDMSPLFTVHATLSAEELSVTNRVHFIHRGATGYIDNASLVSGKPGRRFAEDTRAELE